MANWDWGQMIAQALLTGAVYATLKALIRWIDRRKEK